MDHSHFGRLSSTEFVFLFVEADAERFASLEREIAGFWSTRVGGQPKHVRVKLYNDQFVSVAEELVTYTREQKKGSPDPDVDGLRQLPLVIAG